MSMLASAYSAIAGFLASVAMGLFAIGTAWPAMPYEAALPALLSVGFVGALAGIGLRRRYRKRRDRTAT